MIAPADDRIADQSEPCATPISSTSGSQVTIAYSSEKTMNSSDAAMSIRFRPK
jgi:hypothetical protein